MLQNIERKNKEKRSKYAQFSRKANWCEINLCMKPQNETNMRVKCVENICKNIYEITATQAQESNKARAENDAKHTKKIK